jgi:uncharacterized protein (DUF885 family)
MRHLRTVLCILLCAACRSEVPAAESPASIPTLAMPTPPSSARRSPSDTFHAIAAELLEGYLNTDPVQATSLGDHRYDALWPDMTPAGDSKLEALLLSIRGKMAPLPDDVLPDQDQVDAHILRDQIESLLFQLHELKDADHDPLVYTQVLGDGLDPLLTRSFAPLAERVKSLRARLLALPAVVAAAKGRLVSPSRVQTETAIEQLSGLVDLCDHGLAEVGAEVPDQRAELETAARTAAAALHDLLSFFQHDLLPRSTGSFRRGPDRFAKILRSSVEDDIDAEALVVDARAEMARTMADMVEAARELWPEVGRGPLPPTRTPAEQRALVRKVLSRLGDDATDPKTVLDEASKLLGDATRFVQEHDLVGVPTDPCRVVEMPEYRRGVVVAYCDSSGPLEKKPETVFAIAPAPASWPPKRAQSFYREYNRSMLADLTVHEAMPGHYLQAMHARGFRSDVRAVFESGAFVEGWAVYGEWLMAQHGFGGARVRMQRQKMLLRACANAILDHDVHAGQMDEKAALALMTDEGFQEEAEAVGKWTRARVTSGQLSTYFYGYREMRKLREAAERKPGFSERAFHDKLLASGAPPLRELRWLLSR